MILIRVPEEDIFFLENYLSDSIIYEAPPGVYELSGIKISFQTSFITIEADSITMDAMLKLNNNLPFNENFFSRNIGTGSELGI